MQIKPSNGKLNKDDITEYHAFDKSLAFEINVKCILKSKPTKVCYFYSYLVPIEEGIMQLKNNKLSNDLLSSDM